LLTPLRCLAGGGLHDARAGPPPGRIGRGGESRHRARCGRERGRARTRARPYRVPNVIAQATASRRGAVYGWTVPPRDCASAPTPLAPRLRPFHSPSYPPLLTPARLLHTSARCPLTCFFYGTCRALGGLPLPAGRVPLLARRGTNPTQRLYPCASVISHFGRNTQSGSVTTLLDGNTQVPSRRVATLPLVLTTY